MGKYVLILILAAAASFTIINSNMNRTLNMAEDRAFGRYYETQCRNINNSVVEMLISQLADSTTWRAPGPVSIPSIFNGSAVYSVIDTLIGTTSYIRIAVTGTIGTVTMPLKVIALPFRSGFLPSTVKAAISTNNDVGTLGTLIVDGENHDLNGNLLVSGGTLGIWSTGSVDQGGNSKIGATADGTNYSPQKNAGENIVSQLQGGGYPLTPDSLMGGTPNGYPPGKLKSVAQSGWLGSQYATNPATLTTPLQGVTYLELPNGGNWQSMDLTGSGILIVHNDFLNASMTNINSGTFKGLVIVDDCIHIHNTILGAIACLTPNPSAGNTIGNGTGKVLFSQEAISIAVQNSIVPNYGFAKHRITIVKWYE